MAKRVSHMSQTNGTSTKDIDMKIALRTDQGGDTDASKSVLSLWIRAGNSV
jgi:hypothetical protein